MTDTPNAADDPHPRIPDHELIRQIGRGSYGEVWLARNIMGTYRAVKIVFRSDFGDDRPYEREWHGIKRFEPISRSHDGFVDILQVGRNETDGFFYLVMELADDVNGVHPIQPDSYEPRTLAGIVGTRKPLPFDYCVALGLSLSSAVAHLHNHKLIHRDIKPSNIIFVNGIPKLADIGMVTEAEAASFGGGTPGYLAPDPVPSPRSDVYSLGKVLYEVSTGNHCGAFPSVPTFWQEAEDPKSLSELNEVVLKACENNAQKRYPSARELHEELLLLQAGKSVKRLRSLERRQTLLVQASLAAAIIVVFVLLLAYRIHRGRERESVRLADSFVAAAAQRAGNGDLLGALLWQGVALDVDQHRPERAIRHRMNIESTLRVAPRLVRMFFESSRIRDIAFDPSGNHLAIALDGGRLLVRHVDNGTAVQEFNSPASTFVAIDWHPSGRFIATAAANGTAQIWDLETRHSTALQHPTGLNDVRFSHDGDRLATVGEVQGDHSTVYLWNWTNSIVLTNRHAGHTAHIRTVAFGTNDHYLVTGGNDQRAFLWDTQTMKPLREPLLHPEVAAYNSWVMSCDFSPDGRWLATASFDQLVRVWPTTNYQSSTVLPHQGPVRTVEFSPDAHYLLTVSDDFAVRVWNFRRGTQVTPPLRLPSFPNRATFSPDGRLIAAATADGVVYVWDLAPLRWMPRSPTFFSPDGSRLAQLAPNEIRVFDAEEHPTSTNILSIDGAVSDLKFNHTGSCLLVLRDRGTPSNPRQMTAQLFDVQAPGRKVGNEFRLDPPSPPESPAKLIAGISDDGNRILVITKKVARICNGWTGEILGATTNSNEDASGILSRDGRLAIVFAGSQATLINASNSSPLATLSHPGPVVSACFDATGSLVATACRDDDERPLSAHLWNATNGAPVGNPLPHADGVSQIAFTPDGRSILTAGEDRLIKQWTRDGVDTLRRFRHLKGFLDISLNADGTRMVAAGSDNTVSVWDLTNEGLEGLQLTPPIPLPWNIRQVRFTDKGTRVLVKRLPGDEWTHDPIDFQWPKEWTLYAMPNAQHSWQWAMIDLRPSSLTVAQLTNITRLISAQHLDASGAEFLSKQELKALWNSVQKSDQRFFDFQKDEKRAWHGQEVERAELTGEAFAVRFHLQRFLEQAPDDPEMLDRKRRLDALEGR
ncbi:MAG: protein kinase [Verrucomicrobiales bacterium]|nr:protein kinase [Verrucomicrobiales bacterium]